MAAGLGINALPSISLSLTLSLLRNEAVLASPVGSLSIHLCTCLTVYNHHLSVQCNCALEFALRYKKVRGSLLENRQLTFNT